MTSHAKADVLLAGALASAWAWIPTIEQLNDYLTLATLVVGLLLGIGRLWRFIRNNNKSKE